MPVILFVCTANLFRSPMAAAIFIDCLRAGGLAKSWKVLSAGLSAKEKLPAPDLVQQVMQTRGLDLGAHLSQAVTKELLEQAELVIVMEKRHKEILSLKYPEYTDRFTLLSEMAGLSFDIADPNHSSQSSIQATAREIENLLKRGMERIKARVGHA